ncbi:MAG: RluA family pseudouridine synthase [Campylobacterales bacterium]|nr:RluA family pseudouridine synthase [Campylobacterales bacterium]
MSQTVEKAYKLLSLQEKISNSKAKELIDRGVVYVNNKKLTLAREEYPVKTKFRVEQLQKPTVIFEDEFIIAVNKPPFINSEELLTLFKDKDAKLLHRLDRETSGLLVLTKNEEFRLKAIEEFRKQNVIKEYIAIVSNILPDEVTIDTPIETKKDKSAKSFISKSGKEATTVITPLAVGQKKTKVKAKILTGRTHQIRVHLKSIGFPILGDTKYGGKEYKRLMLHSYKMKLFSYDLTCEPSREFDITEH